MDMDNARGSMEVALEMATAKMISEAMSEALEITHQYIHVIGLEEGDTVLSSVDGALTDSVHDVLIALPARLDGLLSERDRLMEGMKKGEYDKEFTERFMEQDGPLPQNDDDFLFPGYL